MRRQTTQNPLRSRVSKSRQSEIIVSKQWQPLCCTPSILLLLVTVIETFDSVRACVSVEFHFGAVSAERKSIAGI
jgi:hypothetical protein